MEEYDDAFDICPHCGYIEGTDHEPIHMEPGTLLADRYIIGKVLGYGGFGVTYIGWDGKLQQKVAIKEFMPTEFSTRAFGQSHVMVFEGRKSEQFNDGLKKFVEEAKRLAKFQNEPGIVKVFDSFEENNTAYIIMEFLDGETLTKYMEREGIIKENDAVNMLMPVMESLKVVHEKGIIHRDIAPDNIFITKSGEVKLIDFGASRFATTSHSRSLTAIIKPGFSPEEQYRSSSAQGTYTDVYALGATLYKMITGKTPKDSMDRRVAYEQKGKNILEAPSELNKDISINRENAILNAMNIRSEDRTPDIQTFIDELTSEKPAKLRAGKIKKLDFYKWPLWLKILVPVLAALIVVFGILVATGVLFPNLFKDNVEIPKGYVEVPDVKEMDYEEAIKLIEKNDLIALADGNVKSKYVEAGKILYQSPDPGKILATNSTISLVVSSGTGVKRPANGVSTVPLVIWATQEDALEMLKEAGFADPVIETKEDETVEAGKIISQSLDAGKEVPEGSSITIVVSTGKPSFEVPNVVGKSYSKAKKILEQAGLVVTPDSGSGTVTSQTPKAGSKVKKGDTVKLGLSSGNQGGKGESSSTTTKKTTIVVTFNANGGYVGESTKVVTIGSTYGNLPTPTRDYHSFGGWYTEPNGGTNVSAGSTVGSSNVTLYAHWYENSWSGWTTDTSKQNSDYDWETKTQYQYRDKEYKDSSSSSLSGWTQYGSPTVTYGSWSSWSGWSTSYRSSSDTCYVESRDIPATYKTVHNYYHWCTNTGNWWATDAGTYNGHNCRNYHTKQLNSQLTNKKNNTTGTGHYFTSSEKCPNGCTAWYYKGSEQVMARAAYTEYRYQTRDKYTTYHYYRWEDWSSWMDDYIESSSDREVETRTVYRYKQK